MQVFLLSVQYASEQWISHTCLNHRRVLSFQLSATENAVGENSVVGAVITTWSLMHTMYTAVIERGEFSTHTVSDELYSSFLLKLRIGKTVEAQSYLIVSHQKENILLKTLEINRFSWSFFPCALMRE